MGHGINVLNAFFVMTSMEPTPTLISAPRLGLWDQTKRIWNGHFQSTVIFRRHWQWATILPALEGQLYRAFMVLLVFLVTTLTARASSFEVLFRGCANGCWEGTIEGWWNLLRHYWIWLELDFDLIVLHCLPNAATVLTAYELMTILPISASLKASDYSQWSIFWLSVSSTTPRWIIFVMVSQRKKRKKPFCRLSLHNKMW